MASGVPASGYKDLVLFLATAGVIAPLFKRLKISPILGFLGAGVVLRPNFQLVRVIILSQVLNGVLLPVVMIFMLRLINKHELMGKHTNSTWFNWVAWVTAAIVIGLSLVMMWSPIHDTWIQWRHLHGG